MCGEAAPSPWEVIPKGLELNKDVIPPGCSSICFNMGKPKEPFKEVAIALTNSANFIAEARNNYPKVLRALKRAVEGHWSVRGRVESDFIELSTFPAKELFKEIEKELGIGE